MLWQTSLGVIDIAPAKADELPSVVEILDKAALWLIAKGIAQWQSPVPMGLQTLIKNEIMHGHVFLARLSGESRPIAALRFYQRISKLWGDDTQAAGYVYSLALDPEFTGRRIGEALIEWAKDYARTRNCTTLRLDCWAPNMRLRRYYERLGFAYCGTVNDNGYPLALYQTSLEGEGSHETG